MELGRAPFDLAERESELVFTVLNLFNNVFLKINLKHISLLLKFIVKQIFDQEL